MIQMVSAQTRALFAAMLATLIDGADHAKIMLFQNDISPGPETVLGDLTDADFDGYVIKDVAAFPAVFTNDEDQAVVAVPCQFTHGGGAGNNDIYGWALLDSTDALVCAERFPDPIPVIPGRAVVFDAVINHPLNSSADVTTV